MKILIAASLLMPMLSSAANAQAPAPQASTQAAAQAATVVAVDPSIQFQPFQGWGVSLAWWAKVVGGYPEPARSEYIDKTFDAKKGLGLNVVRYNIGGGENPKYLLPNKQFVEFRADMPGFQPEPGQWDWSADKEQRWVLRAAIAKGANQLEAFSNSPPHWMTTSGSVTGNHPGQGSMDNLKPEFDRPFAEYLAEVVRFYRDEWKINFRDIDPLNEPSADWWKFGNHQEGCTIDRPHQVTLIKETAAALKRRGIRLPVSASDESLVSQGVDTLPFYDAEALSVMDKLNVHSYGGGDRVKFANYALSQGKDLWLSEYGDGDASGMETSRRILEDIHGLHPSSWSYWQVVDNSGGWGFLKNPMLNYTDTAYETNRKYFVMGQYSKFIRPGFRFIASGSPNAVAAIDARTRTLVIVATNSKDEAAPMRFDLSRFTTLGASAQVVRTSPSEQWASLPAIATTNKILSYEAPPQSVTTLVVQNAAFAGEMGFDARKYFRIQNAQTSAPLSAESTPQVLEGARKFDEQWNLIGEGSGVYKIVNRRSGLALDVSASSKESGGKVAPYSFNGGANQLWKLQRVASGAYKIANVNSGLLLSFGDDGKSLAQKTDGGGAAQTWKILAAR
jgi:O-glycosyl hydrolase